MIDRRRRIPKAPSCSVPILPISATDYPAQQHNESSYSGKSRGELSNSPCFRLVNFLFLFIGCLVTILWCPNQSFAQLDENQFNADVNYLASLPSRSPGAPGYFKAVDYIQKQIGSLPNVRLRRHEFPMMVPLTESATVLLPDGKIENIYPFWPAGIRVCGTPDVGITGKLVYCKDAELKDIKPAKLNGQIAVLETTSSANWTLAVNLGARAI